MQVLQWLLKGGTASVKSSSPESTDGGHVGATCYNMMSMNTADQMQRNVDSIIGTRQKPERKDADRDAGSSRGKNNK
ncbi:hypothetical protein VTN77DRAFT_1458 [Rasamsonia byssochlamydoides]|uniref:uncharacterized protein n=1 Tax=Rasamsonia byssochlamydoides TaxID=89139 RepID=UPI00374374B1